MIGAEELAAQLNRPNRVVIRIDRLGPNKVRKLHHYSEIGLGVQFRVHAADVQTALRGLIQRVFYHWEVVEGVKKLVRPFQPTKEAVVRLLGQARSQLLRRTGPAVPYSRDQFLAPLAGRKLARYTEAADSVEAFPVTKDDAILQTFVKAEKLNVSVKSDPDPRVIQPRNPRYCYALGLYIKSAEHMLYKAVNRLFGQRTVMKGLNADRRGRAIAKAWNRYKKPAALGLDASRFDQHVSPALLKFEHSIYLAIYNQDPELARLLDMQIRNTGWVRGEDGYLKYTVNGSRMSGDMNTALGNVILMCLMVWAYLQTKAFEVSLINDGDDCVLICEAEHVDQFADLEQWFAQLGMIMKVEEPVYELEKVVFCQSQPIEVTPGVYRMVRDPRICLDKDACSVKPVRDRGTWDSLRTAVADCGLSLAGDIPVYGEYYMALKRGAARSTSSKRKLEARGPETGMEFLAVGMDPKYSEPTECARISFAKAFEIWPDMQIAMEQQYREYTPVWSAPRHVEEVGTLYPAVRW